MTSYYELLGVDPSASERELRDAYRALARQWHPDAGGTTADMAALNLAWAVLRDPTRRRCYDANLPHRAARQTAASVVTPGQRSAAPVRSTYRPYPSALRPAPPPRMVALACRLCALVLLTIICLCALAMCRSTPLLANR